MKLLTWLQHDPAMGSKTHDYAKQSICPKSEWLSIKLITPLDVCDQSTAVTFNSDSKNNHLTKIDVNQIEF